MTVRQEKKHGRFMINFWYRHADGHRERIRVIAQGTTRREAEVEERRIFKSLEDGTFRKKSEVKQEELEMPTVKEFSNTFVDDYAKVENKPSEVVSKQSMLRLYILPSLGEKRLDEVDTTSINGMKREMLASGLAPKTVKNAVAVVSRLMWYAVEVEHIEHAPRCRFPKCPQPDFDYFSFEEAELLLATARQKAPLWYAPIFLALRTGLRRGELFELRWGDVQLKGRSPHLRISRAVAKGIVGTPKNNKTRTVYLTPATVELLEQCKRKAREAEAKRAREEDAAGATTETQGVALAARRALGAQLVFGADDGSLISSNSSDWALRHICDLANLREVGWHVMRHTYASHLAMRGVSLQKIQEQLGHSTVQMTLRYAHLSPDSVSDAVAVLDQPTTPENGQQLGNGGLALV